MYNILWYSLFVQNKSWNCLIRDSFVRKASCNIFQTSFNRIRFDTFQDTWTPARNIMALGPLCLLSILWTQRFAYNIIITLLISPNTLFLVPSSYLQILTSNDYISLSVQLLLRNQKQAYSKTYPKSVNIYQNICNNLEMTIARLQVKASTYSGMYV